MSEQKGFKVNQKASNSRNVTLVGGNYSNTVNINILLLLIGVIALGGLAWALVIGLNEGGQSPQSGQEKQILNTSPTPSKFTTP
ncbi:hypothetical protein [Nostoc sp.]